MRSKKLISTFILGVMVLHLVPMVQEIRSPGQTMWPFMAWGMYRTSHGPPVQASRWEIIAETSRGERREVQPIDAGQGPNGFMRVFARPMAEGDSAVARRLGEILNRSADDPVTRLVVQGTIYRVKDGEVVATPQPPMTFRLGDR